MTHTFTKNYVHAPDIGTFLHEQGVWKKACVNRENSDQPDLITTFPIHIK